MIIKDNIQNAIVTQMNREFYSSFLYLSMASYFESMNLKGFAQWMKVQAAEEHNHGMKFYEYLVKRGAKASISAIEAPPVDWLTPLEAFEHALGHEQKVTEKINELMNIAMSEKDHATVEMLQWFVKEQVEEEAGIGNIVFKMKIASADRGAGLLYILDHELGERGGEVV